MSQTSNELGFLDAACKKTRDQLAATLIEVKEELNLQYAPRVMQDATEQHDVPMAGANTLSVVRKCNQSQFAFTVRGHETVELSGIVPRQIFEAEPDSILNKTYNGDWAYAKDAKGRACINSEPAHWPLILRWLSYGAVPSPPLCTSDFIAECNFWQLDNLLARIEQVHASEEVQQQPAVVIEAGSDQQSIKVTQVSKDRRIGFKMEGRIHNFIQRFASSQKVEMQFAAYGACWTFVVKEQGAYVSLVAGPRVQASDFSIRFGQGQESWELCATAAGDVLEFAVGTGGLGKTWMGGDNPEKLKHYPCVDLHGSLLVTVDLLLGTAS